MKIIKKSHLVKRDLVKCILGAVTPCYTHYFPKPHRKVRLPNLLSYQHFPFLSGKQKEIHSTNAPTTQAIGIAVKKDEEACALINVGAKWRILRGFLDCEQAAAVSRDIKVGEAEIWTVPSAPLAAVVGVTERHAALNNGLIV